MAARQKTFTATGSFEAQVSESITGMVGFQITGISSATITFECTLDDSNWVTILRREIGVDASPSGTTTTADGVFILDAAGVLKVRARVSTYGSGTIIITRMPQIG